MSRAKKMSKQRSNRLKKTAKRLAAYSAVAAATVMTAQDHSAEAEEVVWDIPDVVIGPNLEDNITFNIVNGTTGFYPGGIPNWVNDGSWLIWTTEYYGFKNIYGPVAQVDPTTCGFVGQGGFTNDFYDYRYFSVLASGSAIGPGQEFAGGTGYPQFGAYGWLSNFAGDTHGFIGLRFTIAGVVHYGWAEITGGGQNMPTTLHAMGYNDTPGEPSVTPADVPVSVAPESVTPTEGDFVSGGIAELAESDGDDYSMRRRSSDLQSRTEFEVKSTSPTETPTTFEFTLEGSVFARGNVVQTIELFDYVAGDWELVDTSDSNRAPMPDKVVTATPAGDLSRFVEAGTMCIQARILYKSDRARQKFASNTDQAVWTIQ